MVDLARAEFYCLSGLEKSRRETKIHLSEFEEKYESCHADLEAKTLLVPCVDDPSVGKADYGSGSAVLCHENMLGMQARSNEKGR